MRFPALPPARAASLLQDLRDGWHAFISRRWLWTMVAQFALVTAISTATISVLGPLVAHDSLGGARSWGYPSRHRRVPVAPFPINRHRARG